VFGQTLFREDAEVVYRGRLALQGQERRKAALLSMKLFGIGNRAKPTALRDMRTAAFDARCAGVRSEIADAVLEHAVKWFELTGGNHERREEEAEAQEAGARESG